MPRRTLAVSLAAALAAAVLPWSAAPPAGAATAAISARRALALLAVRTEHGTAGMDRASFAAGGDADRDGCSTRSEVLLAEARTAPTRTGVCTLSGGRWFSTYDGRTLRSPGKVAVDHTVSAEEAFRSGAYRWNSDTRRRFANDLYGRTLRGVSIASALALGSTDPGRKLPALGRCTYVADVVAVKLRWGLSIDTREKQVIARALDWCSSTTVWAPRARVRLSARYAWHHTPFYVGDSLGQGTVPYLSAAGLRVIASVAGGRTVDQGIAVLQGAGLAPGTPIIVDLGTNGGNSTTTFAAQVRRVLALRPSCDTVYWLTIHRSGASVLNATLRHIASTDARLRVAEEAAWALQHPSYLQSDGVHYANGTAYAARARFVAGAINAAPIPACPTG